jgi:uncharacterized membrane protein YbhN (UPF0104 family)/tRNA A-37 threonylcarbamoyl transferase component Bud32
VAERTKLTKQRSPAHAPARSICDGVEVVDAPSGRIRQSKDLVSLTVAALGVIILLGLAVYAHGTAAGVTADIRSFASPIATILDLIVSSLMNLATLVMPAAVLVASLFRRQLLLAAQGAAAALAGLAAGVAASWGITRAAWEPLIQGLSVSADGESYVAIAPLAAFASGALTAMGPRSRRPIMAAAWNLLWLALATWVLTGGATLPAAFVTVLIGRMAGLATRYAVGVTTDRATGAALVAGIRGAGLDPVRIVRVLDISEAENPTDRLDVRSIRDGTYRPSAHSPDGVRPGPISVPSKTSDLPDAVRPSPSPVPASSATARLPDAVRPSPSPVPATSDTAESPDAVRPVSRHFGAASATAELTDASQPGASPQTAGFPACEPDSPAGHGGLSASGVQVAVSDSTSAALDRAGGNRIYAVFDRAGERWDAIVLDGDRQVLGFLQATWRALRLRGMDRRSVRSLRQAAERAALLGYAATAAGVRTPRLVGVGEAADSMMLLQTHPRGLRSMRDMRPSEISRTALVDVWRQLERAHQAGLAHRNITAASLLFDHGHGLDQRVWLIGWEDGDVASAELARSIDCAQLLGALALQVGPERAVAAAAAVLPAHALAALAGLLQPVVFPAATRELARAKKDVIEATRQELLELLPASTTPVAPFQLVRFGWRTVLIAAMTLVAIWAVVTRLNFNQMVEAVGQADPRWMALSFALSLVTYVGAGVTLVALLPAKVPLWRSVLTQVAGSFTAITMPAGLGVIALNLRFLNRRGVRASLAAATVALTQLALFAVTVALIVVTMVGTGQTGMLSNLPTTAIAVVVLVVALLGCLLLVPALRAWIWSKAGPTLTQAWPRVVWVLGRPRRLAAALAGAVVQFGGYVAAFWAAMMSFGLTDIAIGDLALIFLVGNTAGSVAPTPGGLGGVEIALTAGLRALGVATATAASAAVLFRVITYWARVPIGWAAFRYLSKHGDL